MFGHVSYQRIAGCASVWNFKIYVVCVCVLNYNPLFGMKQIQQSFILPRFITKVRKIRFAVANFPHLLRRELGYFRLMHSSFMDLSCNLSWVISKRRWWRNRYLTFWVFPSNIFNSFRRQNHSTFQGWIRKWFSSIICFDVILFKFNFDILIRCRLRQWCKKRKLSMA